MSVNTYVTGKQEADDTSKHVGHRKLTMSVKHGLQENRKLIILVNTWVIGS